MRIAAVSDLHGHLPDIPECDLLLLAGDLCGHSHPQLQATWLEFKLGPWLKRIPATEIVAIAGNHDWVFEKAPDKVPPGLRWHYLQDSAIELLGLRIHGSPWTPWFLDWAFNAPANDAGEAFLDERFGLISAETDILLTHGPAYGFGDFVLYDQEHAGSKALLRHIERVQPRLHVFGHIHEGYGQYQIGNTISANVSYVDRGNRPKRAVMTWDL